MLNCGLECSRVVIAIVAACKWSETLHNTVNKVLEFMLAERHMQSAGVKILIVNTATGKYN